jgi:transcriptional regulator with XRE-family HTH domain
MKNDEVKDRISISKQLRHLLDINGMDTKEKLLEDLGYKHTALQKYLTDNRRPTLEDIVKLANFFNTSVDYIVGKTDLVLDTWDHDFLKEFFNYSYEMIEQHLNEKQRIPITAEGTVHTVLFGLLTYIYLSTDKKTFEDLTKWEQVELIEKFNQIISIFKNSIQLSRKKDVSTLMEINQDILSKLLGHAKVSDNPLENIANRMDMNRDEKIQLVKTYLNENMANTQKALKLLDEL